MRKLDIFNHIMPREIFDQLQVWVPGHPIANLFQGVPALWDLDEHFRVMDLFDDYQQVIFETRDADPFRHQKFERLITELDNDYTFVLCGASIAAGIKQAVLGLRLRGYDVIVAEDAILDLGDPDTEMAWLQVLAKSARPLPTVQILRQFAPQRPASRPAGKAMAS